MKLFLLFLILFFSSQVQSRDSITIRFYENGKFYSLNYRILRPSVALVLSGGGARGLSHIGVLKVFEENNVPIDCIVGASMGSIVGGLYCTGLSPEEISDIALKTNWSNVLSISESENRSELFLDKKYLFEKTFIYFRIKGFKPIIPPYIVSGQKITESLLKIFLQAPYHYIENYDSLKPRFISVATDLVRGQRITFTSGNLIYTIRASATIPLIFQPVVMDSLVLVDGGLISNIPADVARNLNYDIVISVDATSPLRNPSDLQLPWNTADQIVGIMMQLSNKFQIENSDIVIKPDLGASQASDFTKAKFFIQKGEESAREKINEIITLIKSKTKIISDSKQIEIKNYKLLVLGDGLPAMKVLQLQKEKITDTEIASILLDPNLDEYKEINVEIHRNGNNPEIIIKTKLCPEIKKVLIFPQAIENFGNVPGLKAEGNGFALECDTTVLFSENTVELLKKEILKRFRKSGYSFTRIKNFKFDEETGVLSFFLSDGYISKVKILGTKQTKDFVILREVNFLSGEILTAEKIITSLKNLWATGFFSQIKVFYEIGDSIDVTLELAEDITQYLRIGLRVDNERGGQILGDFRNENLLGFGDELGLTAQGGMRNSLFSIEYKVDRILKTMLTYKLNLFRFERNIYIYSMLVGGRAFSVKNIGEIKIIRGGLSISAGGQFEKIGNTLLSINFEKAKVKNITGEFFREEENFIPKIQLRITVDSRDRGYLPMRGVYLNTFFETSQKILGSDVPFSKIFFEYENLNTYSKYGTLVLKFMFGLCDESTPLSQMFFLGSITGLNSLSGLREDEIFGRQILLAGAEARIKLPKIIFDTYLSLKYDLGQAWEKLKAVRWKDMRQGIGIEINFDTPIGPLKIGVGKSFIIRKIQYEQILWGPSVFQFALGFQ